MHHQVNVHIIIQADQHKMTVEVRLYGFPFQEIVNVAILFTLTLFQGLFRMYKK